MSSSTMNFPSASGTGWTNPQNALSLNSVYATSTGSPDTNLLVLSGATNVSGTIDGFVVEVAFSGNFTITSCKLRKSGIAVGTNQAAGEGPATYASIGSSSNLFGTTWSGGEQLGLELVFTDNSSGNTVSVDHVRITIFYNGSNTFNETGSGGILGGGVADFYRQSDFLGAGGSLGGSQADVTTNVTEIMVAGAAVGGAATGAIFDEVASSSGLLGGSIADVQATYSETGSKGAIGGGFALRDTYDETMSGGAVLGSTADVTSWTIDRMSGSILGGSSADVVTTLETILSGGALAGGAAMPAGLLYEFFATGGATCNGDSINRYNIVSTGGLTAGSSASVIGNYFPTLDLTTSFSLTANALKTKLATADLSMSFTLGLLETYDFRPTTVLTISATLDTVPTCNYRQPVSGGSLVGGSAQVLTIKREISVGGIVAGSAATNNQIAQQVSAGGILAGSSALITGSVQNRGSAGIVGSGSARVGVDRVLTNSLSLTTSGTVSPSMRWRPRTALSTSFSFAIVTEPLLAASARSSLGAAWTLTATAGRSQSLTGLVGTVAGGTAPLTMNRTNGTSGGMLASGSAIVTMNSLNVAIGGMLAGGSVLVTTTAVPAIAGGVLTNGSIIVTTRSANVANGGLVVSGSAKDSVALLLSTDLSFGFMLSANYWQHIVEGLNAYLMSKSDLADIIDDQLYVNRFPIDATRPAICYTVLTNYHDHILSGASGIAVASIQFDLLTEHPDDRELLADTLHENLQGQSGYYGAVKVLGVNLDNASDDEVLYGETVFYVRSMQYSFTYVESIPALNNICGTTTTEVAESLVAGLDDIAPVFSGSVPQDQTGPYIVYRQSGVADLSTLLDEVDSNIDSPEYELQITAFRYRDVALMTEQIRQRMQGLSGTLGGTGVWSCVLVDESDAYSQDIPGSDKVKWWNTMSFAIYVES